MDWARYKQLCDQPDYWSRWMLEQCIELFEELGEETLVASLRQALTTDALTAPPDHKGGAATQMYNLDLPVADRKMALQAIELATARGLSTARTQGRGLGGFVEAWREYAGYRESAGE